MDLALLVLPFMSENVAKRYQSIFDGSGKAPKSWLLLHFLGRLGLTDNLVAPGAYLRTACETGCFNAVVSMCSAAALRPDWWPRSELVILETLISLTYNATVFDLQQESLSVFLLKLMMLRHLQK